MDAVFASDARGRIDDNRSFFILGDRFDRTYGRAGGEVAVHTAIARPNRRKPFEDWRFHRDPGCRRQLIKACAIVLVPIFAGLDAMTAADALGRIEKNTAWLTVEQSRGRN